MFASWPMSNVEKISENGRHKSCRCFIVWVDIGGTALSDAYYTRIARQILSYEVYMVVLLFILLQHSAFECICMRVSVRNEITGIAIFVAFATGVKYLSLLNMCPFIKALNRMAALLQYF